MYFTCFYYRPGLGGELFRDPLSIEVFAGKITCKDVLLFSLSAKTVGRLM
jgi:hypothetical protein